MYKIEGRCCFMICPPGLEPRFEIYQMHPNGDKEYLITAQPQYAETEIEEE